MRALLLVYAGLVRVGAFASLPDSEQIESRKAGSTNVKVRSNEDCGNRVCAGKSCAQSRVTVDAAACAAAWTPRCAAAAAAAAGHAARAAAAAGSA